MVARSGLVEQEWYSSQNPQTWLARLGPCLHYLAIGAAESRNPNRWFDTNWYLAQYPDVRRAGMNPLVHYIAHGSSEGRKPHPNFDPEWYQDAYPDIPRGGIKPFAHWLAHGETEGRLPNGRSTTLARMLKVADIAAVGRDAVLKAAVPVFAVDVIVPVFGNLRVVRRCMTSILASRNKTFLRILVIDDCSPEPEVVRYLQELAATGKIVLLRNEANCGFTATVNRGMRESSGDVLLLNSDTEVPSGFVDRLLAHAYAHRNVATVTPFSNYAAICGWPVIGGTSGLPADFSLTDIDAACEAANAGRHYDLPTGIGFCMLIRRAALESLGLFNEQVFGRGYGEESDFCQRALRSGWRNLLAADTFVYHEGAQSFGREGYALRQRAERLLRQLHPRYATDFATFVAVDPPRKARCAAIAALFRASRKPVVLHVIHAIEGGVQNFLDELNSEGDSQHIVLKLLVDGMDCLAELFIKVGAEMVRLTIDLSIPDEAANMLLTFGITRVETQEALRTGHWPQELTTCLGTGMKTNAATSGDTHFPAATVRGSRPYDIEADWNLMTTCNFRCSYCYWDKEALARKIVPLASNEHIASFFDATGLAWLLHITGGEPFAYPGFVELCSMLTRRHLISINTNGDSDRIQDFARCIDPARVDYVHFSVHVRERDHRNGVDRFVRNIEALRSARFETFCSCVMHPDLFPMFPETWESYAARGIVIIPKALQGSQFGRKLPEGYTADERAVFVEYARRAEEHYRDQFAARREPPTVNPLLDEDLLLGGQPNFRGQICAAGDRFVRIWEDGNIYRCGKQDMLGSFVTGQFDRRLGPSACTEQECPYFCEKYLARGKSVVSFRSSRRQEVRTVA